MNLPIGLNVLGLEVDLDAITVGTNPAYGDQVVVSWSEQLGGWRRTADLGVDSSSQVLLPAVLFVPYW